MENLNNYRKQGKEYLIKSIVNSRVDKEKTEVVGKVLLDVYLAIHYPKDINEDFKEDVLNYLFFLDIVNIYILNNPIQDKYEDKLLHFESLKNRDDKLYQIFMKLYN